MAPNSLRGPLHHKSLITTRKQALSLCSGCGLRVIRFAFVCTDGHTCETSMHADVYERRDESALSADGRRGQEGSRRDWSAPGGKQKALSSNVSEYSG